MTERLKEELVKNGVDLKTAMERFMGREDLYEKFLVKFLNDQNYIKLAVAVAEEDADSAFIAAHTLKGVTGNLGLNGMLQPLAPLVETLRNGKLDGAAGAMELITANYEAVCQAIKNEM